MESGRREVAPVTSRQGAELIPLDPLVNGLGLGLRADPAAGSVTLSRDGRTLVLYDGKSLASLSGDLRLLSAPVVLDQGRWLVPLESIHRVLGPLVGKRAEWRPEARVLLVGDVSLPRLTVTSTVGGTAARVVIEASEKVPFRVLQETTRVTVAVPVEVVDTPFRQEALTGGIVESVRYLGGREHVFAVQLGPRFRELRAVEQATPPRLVLDFLAGQGLPEAAASPPPAPLPAPPPAGLGPRTVVLDPGHGGEEVGAQGPAGTLEKDVTLAIARRVRAGLADSLGLQVFLTRDRDQAVSLDDRTAVANNYKADLFVSIHANASRAASVRGSEVYFLSYQASDDESRRVAAEEGGFSLPEEATAPASDLALILWDMAQAQHLEDSSALASRVQEELAEVTGSQGRGVKQAPFRVLVGAAMPAILVEVAFLSHPEEEKLLVSEPHQARIAAALVRGIARYLRERGVRDEAAPAFGAPR